MGCIFSKNPTPVNSQYIPSAPNENMPKAYHDSLSLVLSLVEIKEQRHALADLQGDEAKHMVEFLDKMLRREQAVRDSPFVKKHVLHTLASLARSALVFPENLKLSDLGNKLTEALHSEGRFGNVYKKNYKGREASIKVTRDVKPGNGIQGILRINAKEAVLRAYMSHPNILPLYGVHVTEGAGEKSGARKIWIVSPWMQNGDLLGYSQKHPERAFYLMSDVISGLNYLHKLEIVHGDLRATNVLVSGAGRAILANFEVSRVSMPDPTMSDTAVGEMWWMALELLNDKAIPTRASDIWAFACTCYEVMTGQTPFRHQGMTQASLMSALDKPDSAIPTRPTLRSREEEQLWANLLVRCWKHAPRGRPDTDAIIRYFSKWKSADNTAELDEDSARLWQVNRPESRANVDYELVYRVLLRVNGAV